MDATVMGMINGHEMKKGDFILDAEEPGCFLTRDGIRTYLSKLEKKFQTEVRYLGYVDYAVSFRRGIALQADLLVKAIEALGYGFRIQKSAFEALITKKKYKELLERLPAYVSQEDSIRVYKIIGKGQVVSFGKKAEKEDEDIIVI